MSAASDFGPAGVLERFEQVAPKVIFSVDKVVYVVGVRSVTHATDDFIGTTARSMITRKSCESFSKVWPPKTYLLKRLSSYLHLLILGLNIPAGLPQKTGYLGQHSFLTAERTLMDEMRTEKLSGIKLRLTGLCGFYSAPEQPESPNQSFIALEECYFKR